jgi:hypothetical protein
MLTETKKIIIALQNMLLKGWMPWRLYVLLLKAKTIYYKWYCKNMILKTKPIETGKDCPYFAVHLMTRHQDIYMTLWAVKTFLHFTGKHYRVALLTDDSITKNDMEILTYHLPNVEFIFEKEAESTVEGKIKDYPLVKLFRLPSARPCPVSIGTEVVSYDFCPFSMKLLDGNYLSTAEKIMILDSDVLFFDKPTDIMAWIENPQEDKSLYMVEEFEPYYDKQYNIHFRKVEELPIGINTGLFCYHKKILDLAALEKWIDENKKTAFTLRTAEQHAYGYLARLQNHAALPGTYTFNNRQSDSIATHFGIKHLFYQNLKTVGRALGCPE